jgi:hypothetical protein
MGDHEARIKQHLLEWMSLVLSVLAAVASVYLWVVSVYNEQPHLRAHLVDAPEDRLSANADHYYLSRFYKGEQQGLFYYLYLKTVVLNESTLPTSVVGMKSWVKSRAGSWLEASAAYATEAEEDKYHPIGGNPSPLRPDWRDLVPTGVKMQDSLLEVKPFLVPARQGVFVRMLVWVRLGDGKVADGEDYKRAWRAQADQAIASPVAVKLELTGLGNSRFTEVLTDAATPADARQR